MSINSDVAGHTTTRPSRSSPSPPSPRARKMANLEEEESQDEHRGQAWRTPIQSDSDPSEPMRTFAIEPDHPLIPHWDSLLVAIKAALEQQSVLYPWRAIEVFRRRRTLQPSPAGTDDTTVLVSITKGADKGYRDTLAQSIKETCTAHGQPTLQVEVIEYAIWRS